MLFVRSGFSPPVLLGWVHILLEVRRSGARRSSDRPKRRMEKSTASYQVLVVDDSAVYRKLVEHALESQSYSLLFAKTGLEALALFQQHSPSIVITDWMMPDFSGLQLCE